MVGVDFFCECEYTDPMNIMCQSCFKLRYVGWMNMQVWLLNMLVCLAGWVNSELVGSMRNTERMMFNYVHNVEMPSEKCLTFCLFPLFARLAEWRNVPCQNHLNYASSESRDRKMFGNKNSFSCQSNFAFCCDKIHPKPYRGLPQASHGITVVFLCRQVFSKICK